MQRLSARGVQSAAHPVGIAKREFRHWDAARVFLEVVRKGSFRGASAALQLAPNSIRARIGELERALGTVVLVADVTGVRLTPDGEALITSIEEMEEASFNLLCARAKTEVNVSGEVRLVVSEGLGAFWVTPRLVEFQRANPKLTINLEGVVHSADISRLEADALIQLHRPSVPDTYIKKIGRLHLIPFAAPSYLETFGRPRDIMDLRNHRIVIQADTNKDLRATFDRIFGDAPREGLIAFRSNVGSAYYWALAQGSGIGLLPTYASALGAPLVPLDIGLHETLDIWLAYHPEMKRTAKVKRLIDWIISSFDPRRFPWFRDDFIHPDQLESAYKGEPLATLFSGFLGR